MGGPELEHDIALVLENQVIREILTLVDGLVVVLNTQRQIVGLNKKLQSFIGADDPDLIFGKRSGEAINCVYSDATPGGCGTSPNCTSCGVIGTILECQKTGEIVERKAPSASNILTAIRTSSWPSGPALSHIRIPVL